jgi:hypothetical protein
MKMTVLATLVIATLVSSPSVEAGPVNVRMAEGHTRGFLVLRTMDGKALAHGEMAQQCTGQIVRGHLTLNFADGSLWDEHVTYSQDKVFRLEAFQHVQRGPSFPTSEVSFDRRSGRFKARIQEKKGDEVKEASGPFDMPPDLYNGMTLVLLKNSAPDAGVSGRMAIFTPEPRLIKMNMVHEGEDTIRVGPIAKTAWRYLVKLDIGGLTGLLASWVGKVPPDLRYWLMAGDVPAFARFQGAMYLNGPVWRIELTPVEWPK